MKEFIFNIVKCGYLMLMQIILAFAIFSPITWGDKEFNSLYYYIAYPLAFLAIASFPQMSKYIERNDKNFDNK